MTKIVAMLVVVTAALALCSSGRAQESDQAQAQAPFWTDLQTGSAFLGQAMQAASGAPSPEALRAQAPALGQVARMAETAFADAHAASVATPKPTRAGASHAAEYVETMAAAGRRAAAAYADYFDALGAGASPSQKAPERSSAPFVHYANTWAALSAGADGDQVEEEPVGFRPRGAVEDEMFSQHIRALAIIGMRDAPAPGTRAAEDNREAARQRRREEYEDDVRDEVGAMCALWTAGQSSAGDPSC